MEAKNYVFYKRVKRPLKFVFDKLYCPKYIGLENIPEKPYILAGNHTSMLDIPLLISGIDDPINFMAKEELFKNKAFAKILEKMHAFPVKRGQRDMEAMRHALLTLREGGVLGIFPEGTRNKSSELLEFQSGSEVLAKAAKAPIVPFGIVGDYGFRSRVCLCIGEPLDPMEVNKNPEMLRDKVKELIRR